MNRTASIYQDMATRTGSSVYIGVVGPVRTGKSTFIKRFMQTQVIPHIENAYRRDRAQDELPQSGSGRIAILTVACTDCKCVAGRGMPLPYNASSMPRPCEITCVHPASAG